MTRKRNKSHRQCARCRERLPLDSVFYYCSPRGRYDYWCRACRAEYAASRPRPKWKNPNPSAIIDPQLLELRLRGLA